MNDNNPPRDALVSKYLTRSVIVEQAVIERVPEVMRANDVPQKVIDAVLHTVEPAFKLQQEAEKEVVGALLAVPSAKLIGEAFDALVTRIEKFAEDFSALANTPAQMKLVAGLREFVEMASAKEKETGKEPSRDFERE